jgi:hypothetical protein
VLFAARLALKEYDDLDDFLKKQTKEYPDSYLLWQQLLLMNVARNDAKAMGKMRSAYRQAMRRKKYSKDLLESHLAMLQAARYYAEGRFGELLEGHGKSAGGEWWRFVSLIGLDRLDEAAKVLAENESVGGTWNELAFSAALWAAGKREQADALFQKTHEGLLNGGLWDVALAKVLQGDKAPALERLDSIVLDYRQKAIVALVLAQRESGQASELFGRARKLNWSFVFPYHLVNKLTTSAAK